ncbi:MAG: helix-turn-helix domain-containing protein [Sandaracinaceae bacterium]|nr:helix-turn-helix domain-containing protein [Sandaracinaceae bacterium]MDW8245287.1 helix-turn-helix transcriptional regulator [Sandaracinaceae bacterium]
MELILVSDRNIFFENHLRRFSSITTRPCAPAEAPFALHRFCAVLFDGEAEGLDEDELLTQLAFCRSMAIPPAVLFESPRFEGIWPLLDDICEMRVGRSRAEHERVLSRLMRMLEPKRTRFEYLTLSPCGDGLIVLLANASAFLLQRPLTEEDDGSEIVDITIDPSAHSAKVVLASGRVLPLHAEELAQKHCMPGGFEGAKHAEPFGGDHFGARLKALRLAAGLTQAELARRSGIHRPNIARLEAGKHMPSLDTIHRLARAMGIPASAVFDWKLEKH